MPGGLSEFPTISPLEAARRYLDGQPGGATVAVALSGGGDSVGLLVALIEAASQVARDIRIAAVTVDHGLRSESPDEALAMAEFCRLRSVPHLILPWTDVKPATGVSAAARQARYRLLAEGCQRLGADCLATAHTLDDQLETVEMRRLRSETSLRGLAGIAPAALFFGTLAVHRPFLCVLRADIRRYLTDKEISWFDDPSNENPKYERVRVRQAGRFVHDAADVLAAARRRTALAVAAGSYLLEHARMPLPMLFSLDLPPRNGDQEAFALALAALIALAGGQTQLPGEEQLERLNDLSLLRGSNASLSVGRTVVERRRDVFFISRDRRNLPTLNIRAGEITVWDGRFRVAATPGSTVISDPYAAAGVGQGLPPRIAQRAFATQPDPATVPSSGVAALDVSPYLALFETVLSSFDRSLADALCQLTGRPVFPDFMTRGLETFPIQL